MFIQHIFWMCLFLICSFLTWHGNQPIINIKEELNIFRFRNRALKRRKVQDKIYVLYPGKKCWSERENPSKKSNQMLLKIRYLKWKCNCSMTMYKLSKIPIYWEGRLYILWLPRGKICFYISLSNVVWSLPQQKWWCNAISVYQLYGKLCKDDQFLHAGSKCVYYKIELGTDFGGKK